MSTRGNRGGISTALRLAFVAVAMLGAAAATTAATPGNWTATWATAAKAPTGFFDAATPPPVINDTTFRQIVRISVGGKLFRVWLTNEFGTRPLTIDAAALAVRDSGAAIAEGSSQALTFNGAAAVTIPAGARVVSDPVELDAAHRSDLAVSLHLAADLSASASPVSFHVRALQTNYVLNGAGDQTQAPDLPTASTVTQWYFLAGVDVALQKPIPVIAALGDSITDGDQLAATEPVDLNHRYTDFLAERILNPARGGAGNRLGALAATLNLGISGGQATDTLIGENALARLDRDVLTRSGVTHLIFLEGINDIGLPTFLNILDSLGLFDPAGLEGLFGRPFPPIEVEQIILVHQQIVERARSHGITTVGATLPPAGNSLPGYSGFPAEDKRQALNHWIRNSGVYDLVVDFDAVLRDPSDPTLMQGGLTADGLHPNSAGYQAMADEVFRVLFPAP